MHAVTDAPIQLVGPGGEWHPGEQIRKGVEEEVGDAGGKG